MKEVLIKIWVGLAIILPALFGLMLFITPTSLNLANSVAIRNIVFSVLILLSVIYFPKRVVALLLFGRGLTDFFDGILGIIYSGEIGPEIFPIFTSILSFTVAYYLFKHNA